MRKYLQDVDSYFPTSDQQFHLFDKLPANNFIVKFIPMRGPAFIRVSDFELPPKLYGATSSQADRICGTFIKRKKSTGVLLHGEKGSGKSLTVKLVSKELAKHDMPTILVNEPPGDAEAFSALISSINQPCAVIFDEFDKNFNEEHQNSILSLLDGVFQTNMLFLFTCNNEYKISQYMKNRPGRIFYSLAFTGLSPEAITDYCEENLRNKTYVGAVGELAKMFDNFNFDMLQAVVEEMNRYDEHPLKAMEWLNIRPNVDRSPDYLTVKLTYNDKILPTMRFDSTVHADPINSEYVNVELYEVDEGEKDPFNLPKGMDELKLTSDDLIREETNLKKGVYTYHKDGFIAVLTKPKKRTWDYTNWLSKAY